MGLSVVHTLAWLQLAGLFGETGCSKFRQGVKGVIWRLVLVEALVSSGRRHGCLGLGREIQGDR